jgi:hypothetical protein
LHSPKRFEHRFIGIRGHLDSFLKYTATFATAHAVRQPVPVSAELPSRGDGRVYPAPSCHR